MFSLFFPKFGIGRMLHKLFLYIVVVKNSFRYKEADTQYHENDMTSLYIAVEDIQGQMMKRKPTKLEHGPKSPREERTTSKWSQVLQRYSFASSPNHDDDDDDDEKDGNDGDDILVVRIFCWMTLPI